MAQRGQARAVEKASSSEQVPQNSGAPAGGSHSAWQDAQRGGNSRLVVAASGARHQLVLAISQAVEMAFGGAFMLLAPVALS